jgi:2'-5' RNA ligase
VSGIACAIKRRRLLSIWLGAGHFPIRGEANRPVRVFVAIDVPDEVRVSIAKMMESLRPCCPSARWVRPEGVHVTLKFIGEAQESLVEKLKEALRPIRMPEPVGIRYCGLGFFPRAQHPKVLWAGIEGTPSLELLASSVEEALAAHGIPKETRPFKPHLTMARFKPENDVSRLRKAVEGLATPEFGAAHPKRFRLYQSLLRPAGAEYVSQAEFRFVEDRSCPTG